MAIQKEIWVKYIIGNLFKNNEFLMHAFNADEYVLQGAVVHIPQAGATPSVVKNRSSYPATVVRRTDTDITYALDEYTSDPTHIEHADTVELSYDKIDSVLGEHVSTLRETIADDILIKWAPTTAAQYIPTTGAATLAHLPAATGNRKKLLKEDLKAARTLMNKHNIPREDRYALLDSDMMDQLLDDDDLKKRDSSMELDMKGGVVARLYGFDLLERSTSLIYNNAGTPAPKALGAAGATTDRAGVLCWQKNQVERALGTVDFFDRLRDPEYFGDIYSALVRMGGRKRRADNFGVVSIIQDNAS